MLVAAALAGAVRGFAGFGAAMILMPVFSALTGTLTAVPLMLVLDTSMTVPLVYRAVRRARWPEVLPLAAGAVVFMPLGIRLLVVTEPLVLRWGMSIFVLLAVLVLASGWRYRRAVPLPLAAVIGAAAGLASGLLGMSGPIIVLFWLAGQSDAAQARANIISYFALSAAIGFVAHWQNDLLTARVFILALTLAPVYALSLFLGSRYFSRASEALYRRFAMALIALVAIASLFV